MLLGDTTSMASASVQPWVCEPCCRSLREQVDLALKGLDLRPRNILRYRYGLHSALGRPLTLNEVRAPTVALPVDNSVNLCNHVPGLTHTMALCPPTCLWSYARWGSCTV